ncbi:hypothetical protein NDU88_006278 [Pleurodeles waltl]|uniref:Uncharacterized protein n=1 Tax=Pleurodeles waltl TaxID=8319 RepID=A0AAV7TDT8_PLEWA|nr:hypothetical protein NDU88_006278 [Pleurodeles waltl]
MERGPGEVLWPSPTILLVNPLPREAVPVRIGECWGTHGLAARPDRGKWSRWLAEENKGGSPGVGLALGNLLPLGRAVRRSTRRLREAADSLRRKLAWARMVNC